jgi:hypothetical protein
VHGVQVPDKAVNPLPQFGTQFPFNKLNPALQTSHLETFFSSHFKQFGISLHLTHCPLTET